MSKFSGKCDLYDHIYIIHGQGLSEKEAFERFKDATGGIIYKHYTIKADKYRNKVPVEVMKAIRFFDMLDLVKYYPYVIATSSYYKDENGKEHEHVVLSENSYVDTIDDDMYFHDMATNSHSLDHTLIYREALKQEYIRLVKEYY